MAQSETTIYSTAQGEKLFEILSGLFKDSSDFLLEDDGIIKFHSKCGMTNKVFDQLSEAGFKHYFVYAPEDEKLKEEKYLLTVQILQ